MATLYYDTENFLKNDYVLYGVVTKQKSWALYCIDWNVGRCSNILKRKVTDGSLARQLFEDWLKQHPDTLDDQKLPFSKSWKELAIGVWSFIENILEKPFSISKADCVFRDEDYLKNIWSIRLYFHEKFGIDLSVINNGNQMLPHRNGSSDQATLAFKNQGTFPKKKY